MQKPPTKIHHRKIVNNRKKNVWKKILLKHIDSKKYNTDFITSKKTQTANKYRKKRNINWLKYFNEINNQMPMWSHFIVLSIVCTFLLHKIFPVKCFKSFATELSHTYFANIPY